MIPYNTIRRRMYHMSAFFIAAMTLLGCRSVNTHTSDPTEGGISGFGTPPSWLIWESFNISIQSYVLNDQIHFQIANHNDKPMLATQIVHTLYLNDGSEQKAARVTNVKLKANDLTHVTIMKDLSKLAAQFTDSDMPILTHRVYIDGFESPGLLASPLLKNPPTPANTSALYSPINDSTSDMSVTGFWFANTPISSHPLKINQETEIELHMLEGIGDIEFSSELESIHPELGNVLVVKATSATLRVQKTAHGFIVHNSGNQYLAEEATNGRPIHTVKLLIKAAPASTLNGLAALTLLHSQNEMQTQFSYGIATSGN